MPEADTDRVTRKGRRALIAASVGYGLDGFDLLILSFALSGIIADFHLTDARAGSLATITLIGAVVGGFTFGALSDRYGRIRVLTYSIILFAVFTGLSAIAQGYWDLAVYRFIAGVGIGGEFGIGMTLAAESVPARWRARATSWVGIGFQTGVFAAALLSAPIIGAFGWRGLFAVGLIPAVAAIVFRKTTPESEIFERSVAEGRRGGAYSVARLFADGPSIRHSIAMIVLTGVQNFGYFGIMTWLPHYLSTSIGLSVTKSSLWTAVTVIGMATGIITFGQLADRIGRRWTFWAFQIGAMVSVLVYAQLTSAPALMIGGFVMGIFANGMLGGYGALLAELYPTEARATASNVLFNIGRGLGGFAPVVIALVASAHGFGFALGLLAALYALQFLAMFLIPERRGTELT